MATLSTHQTTADKELIASPMGLIDADDFRNQSAPTDALFPENGDDDSDEEYIEEEDEEEDEPVDEEGDPTGEHDHHQDDNYALGGHVTRSGSV